MANSQFQRDLERQVGRRQALAGLVLSIGGAALAGCEMRAAAQSNAAGRAANGDRACLPTPTETRGPFPADGTGRGGGRAINVLDMGELERVDIRPSFAGLEGRAEGVPLELELRLVGGESCKPLSGRAIYLWQNDAAGDYSLYNLPQENYLRGIQRANGGGLVRFTSIVPGCYGGRYPHCHFEVFHSVEAAAAGEPALLVSQLAFPRAECEAIYAADARYGDSLANLRRMPITQDFVFADNDAAAMTAQTLSLSGDGLTGFSGTATVTLA